MSPLHDGSLINRRALLRRAGQLSAGAFGLDGLAALAFVPDRVAASAPPSLPDIQFALGAHLPPAQSVDGVLVQLAPVYTMFATIKLRRTPRRGDPLLVRQALETIEASYPFSPSGVFTIVSYGLPYFHRLPAGLTAGRMPRLLSDGSRYALEEAVPGPTDVGAENPDIVKQTFNVPVRIEDDDMLITVRSDKVGNLADVIGWLAGGQTTLAGKSVGPSGLRDLIRVTSKRVIFQQIGLPRRVADHHQLPYASVVNPESPMWLGFASQQVSASGPPAITTFAGTSSVQLTTERPGTYFDHGAIVHLSHVIMDLAQYYATPDETYLERVQYMFRSNPPPSMGYSDQFRDGGGPAFLRNAFNGTDDAAANAAATGTYHAKHRLGHVTALQRSSRSADGTPMHVRTDGPGFDSLDVPDGSMQPKLHFSMYFPTADFFRTLRRNQASLDLAKKYGVTDQHNGIERVLTATRRQNFLVPPRRHRAFPLMEFIRD